jgi:MFS family permease
MVSVGRGYADRDASREWATPTGIAAGVGAVLMVVAGIVAASIPAADKGWRFGVIVAAVLLFAACSLDQVAISVAAVTGALIFNGFLEDRFGQLSWHADDLWRLLLLVMVAAFGLALGEGYRYVRDLRLRYRTMDGIAPSEPSTEEEKHGA